MRRRPTLKAVLTAAAGTLAVAGGAAAVPTQADEADAVAALTTLANENGRVPELVRFAFHSTFFGAHGCLDLDDADNAGLATVKARVDALYDGSADSFGGMSRADFWALAGIVGVRVAAGNQGGANPTVPDIVMRYGRVDMPASCVGAGQFPNALGGFSESMATLGAKYGLTPREVTVLMGAHSLGSAEVANSGFRGPWAPPTDRLDNGFYRQLAETGGISNNWEQVVAPKPPGGGPDKRFWASNGRVAPGEVMMLNTDMSLLYDIGDVESAADGLSPTCPADPTGCPRASFNGVSTADVVDEMAADNTLFLTEFAAVFTKMVEVNVSDTLQAASADASAAVRPAPLCAWAWAWASAAAAAVVLL